MPATNYRQFAKELDDFAEGIAKRAILFQKKVAFMVLGAYLQTSGGIVAQTGLLQLTPVDTGRAVGNWLVSTGAPRIGTIAEDFGGGAGGEGNRTAAAAKVQLQATAALSGLRAGQSIFICNSLPYIVVLNDGATNRTAHHMVERALDNARRALGRSA